MEKVSIIVTTYKRPRFLKYAINSVLKQTYPNKEIIIVDGSSDHDTAEVLEYFKDKITVVKDKKNKGVAAARNIGLKSALGDYITFLDDDDVFHPQKVERQIRLFKKSKNIGLVYCPVGFVTSNKLIYKPLEREKNNNWVRLNHGNHIIMTPLIKKECFSVCGDFDENLLYLEDRDFWYRVGQKYKFEFINYPYYIWYNLNIERLSSQLGKICNNCIIYYEKYKDNFCEENKYFSDLQCELAHLNLKFLNIKKSLYHIKKAIEINPNDFCSILFRYKSYVLNELDTLTGFGYRKIKIDKEVEKIFSA